MASEAKHQLVTRAFITPECRENRGADGAWEEAVQRLRTEYEAQIERSGDAESMEDYEGAIHDLRAAVSKVQSSLGVKE